MLHHPYTGWIDRIVALYREIRKILCISRRKRIISHAIFAHITQTQGLTNSWNIFSLAIDKMVEITGGGTLTQLAIVFFSIQNQVNFSLVLRGSPFILRGGENAGARSSEVPPQTKWFKQFFGQDPPPCLPLCTPALTTILRFDIDSFRADFG